MRIVTFSGFSMEPLVVASILPKKGRGELKLPEAEIDVHFPSYLTDLASSVRRGTT
jgi:hypothetical protein